MRHLKSLAWSLWLRIRALIRTLWVRVLVLGLLGIVAAPLAKLMGGLIPDGMASVIGARSVNNLLSIIANSMLAVTTFSLSVIVTIHRSVAGQWTPRAHRMLLRDTPTQTVLATFIGAYIYALTAIVLMSTPFFGEKEVVVLFGMTLGVIILIVVMLVRWILRLQSWGSLMETSTDLERTATQALQDRAKRPCYGANPLTAQTVIPPDAIDLVAGSTGYIQQIDFGALSSAADRGGAALWLIAPVGRFVQKGDLLGHLGGGSPQLADTLARLVQIGATRTPDQDPRFGLIMLSEIGSRALSPGINDPGTAIDIIGRIARTLEAFRDESQRVDEPIYPNLWIPVLDPATLVTEAFAPIARDGATQVEVQIALQKRLNGLTRSADPALYDGIRQAARTALAQANDAMRLEDDRQRLAAVFRDA